MRNPTYEQSLHKQGVDWSYLDSLALADIDPKRSLANQARLESPIHEDLVEQYTAAAKDGDQFPPLVVYRPAPRGRYVLIDGNQRYSAFGAAGRKEHDAYLVNCQDEKVIDRITWTWNNQVNGRRLTPDEAMEHATTFVRKYGMPMVQAAKEWGVVYLSLQRRLKALEIKDVLNKNRVNRADAISDDRLFSMAPLQSAGEDILSKAATVVVSNGLTLVDTQELIAKVRHARTHDDKIKAIDAIAESDPVRSRRAETKNGTIVPRSPSPRDRFSRLLTEIQRIMEDYPEPAALRPPGNQYKDARETASDIVERLAVIFGLGKVPSARGGVG